ncbi:invasion associated locus B family protein [Roseovarius sp. LXJ103]|uniref:invasion associated locus B family protein n=1 Tax=Roseovarius carneus TaxID=2853164 RepID=UPI000D60690C|nr:invasion associated locus B family protein [Roseovarius carneus]MBZ8119407.1 invasion associated locus B family protein [Roseovarius carneus]PWE37183.1 invasion-associated locus B family protein [Pelagicola sp. LXJ1103]
MPKSLSILSFAAALALGSAALAQEATTEGAEGTAPAAEAAPEGDTSAFATGTEVTEAASPSYIKETFGDWSLRCFRMPEGQEDACQLYQLLREEAGNPIAEFSLFRIAEGGPAVAGASVIVPLVTLLPAELKIAIDGGTAKSYPYRVCTEVGCIAQLGLTDADVEAFKQGANATITLVPAQAPDQQVNINVSLSGFTAGFEAVSTFAE